MKKDGYQKRFYRRWRYSRRLFVVQAAVQETDLQVLTDRPVDRQWLAQRIRKHRDAIEEYINYKDRRFLASLKPIAVELTAPAIVQDMARSARKAGVGPMAAVAGALAQAVGRDLLRRGIRDVIVENGGDIFLRVSQPVRVGIFAGTKRSLSRLALRISPSDTPLSVCASSGTVGHSVSFGFADSAVILAKNACLADAVATATCNRVKSKDDLGPALSFARSVRGVTGCVIILANRFASWGRVEFASSPRA